MNCVYCTSNYPSTYLLPLLPTPMSYLLSLKECIGSRTCNDTKIQKQVFSSAFDGWRGSLWRSSRKRNQAVFSYWSVCSWHTGLKLHNPGPQVHRNTWTSSGVADRSCWKRAEQTGRLAWVHRQHWEAGGTCPWKAVSLQSGSELSLQISQCWSKGTWPQLFAKERFFWCWLLTYPVHCYLLITLHYAFFILVVKF